jgi:Zn-dependent protease
LLLRLLDQIQANPFEGLVTLGSFCLALLVAFTVHEFSHALSATRLGDPTAKDHGRLSLHPAAHLDPLGTIMILLAGFGWAKPVPVNPAYLSVGPRTGMALVAVAGPLSNIMTAAVLAIPINTGLVSGDPNFAGRIFFGEWGDVAGYVLVSTVFWNLLLAAFNLIPLVPLDGFKVALGLLPREAAYQFGRLERYGPTPLLLLIMLGFLVPGTSILARIVGPMIDILADLVLW